MTNPCPSDQMPVRCSETLQRVADRLGSIEAKLEELQTQNSRAHETFGQFLQSQSSQETRLTLLEAATSAVTASRKTWAGRIWQLVKAAALFVSGYVLNTGEPR